MLFCTVRITNTSPAGVSTGTGFFFDAGVGDDDPHVFAPLVITNKHVVEGATDLKFGMLHSNADGTGPILGNRTDVHMSVDRNSPPWVGHPDPEVDVVALMGTPLYAALRNIGIEAFTRVLGADLFPTPEVEKDIDAIEELTFVGYPNGQADDFHHTPIVRRAITATPLALPFGGKPTFLLDGSVFGGSSGSPVFVYDKFGYASGDSFLLSPRLLLVGIVSATMLRPEVFELQVNSAPHVQIARNLNLGIAYSWKSIDETVEFFCATHGIARRPHGGSSHGPASVPDTPSKIVSSAVAFSPASGVMGGRHRLLGLCLSKYF